MEVEAAPTVSGTAVARSRRRTYASVFIIESLEFDDETAGRLEGDVLTQILRLSGKDAEYRYIRTKKELEAVVGQFAESGMRYLHFSCHGNDGALFTTLDEVPFRELRRMLQPHLKGRRVFVSACEAVNPALAEALLPDTGCYSIIGPAGDVGFGDAAVMWAAFYHLMFKQNASAMKGADIRAVLKALVNTFHVPMTYIRQRPEHPFWRELPIEPDV